MGSSQLLGCLPKVTDKRTLQLSDYVNMSTLNLSTFIPGSFDYSRVDKKDLVYSMLGNDKVQNCVTVSSCHQIGTWSGQTGEQQVITEEEAIKAYIEFAGYNPSFPCTDQGAVMLFVAMRWRYEQIAGHKIAAFLEVNKNQEELVNAAAYLAGGLWVGWDIPKAWEGADSWETGPSTSGDWAPRSLGGHATHIPGVSPKLLNTISWEKRIPTTWNAFRTYCSESYVLLSNDLWTRLENGLCPPGIDFEKMKNDLSVVTK